MSAERFDAGVVLERATPVLTFSADLRPAPPPAARSAAALAGTPTPPPVSVSLRAKRGTLPVIPRIVRRTMIDGDRTLLRPVAHVVKLARDNAVRGILLLGLTVAMLALAAGVVMRSAGLSPSLAALATSDAIGVEPVLAREPLLLRVERPAEVAAESQPTGAQAAETSRDMSSAPAAAQETSTAPLMRSSASNPHHAAGKLATSHAAARPLASPKRSTRHPEASLQARR